VSTLEDTRFLKEFSKSFDGVIDVFHINFITRLSLLGFSGRHLHPLPVALDCSKDVSKTFNVLSGRLSLEAAEKAYTATEAALGLYKESVDDVVFFLPSGRHVHHVAATDFACENGLKRTYINYSNFPGYTFFDPNGTDCLSSVFDDPSRLDRLFPESVDVAEVFARFSKMKRDQKVIPQAAASKTEKKLKHLAFFADTCIQRITGIVGDRQVALFESEGEEQISLSFDEEGAGRYYFFPLQVSTDQQVLVNYEDGSIYAAIDEAVRIAEGDGVELYIREHPAEGDKVSVRRYLQQKRKDHSCIKVPDLPVSVLIEGAERTITINSTVGLEVLINGGEVMFLGRSFYGKATRQQLAKYLSRYLVCVDYHAPSLDRKLVGSILAYEVV